MDTVFPKQRYAENKTGIMLFYKAEDGKIELDVRLQEETVWLSLRQMAELFDRDKSVISRHLRNVFRWQNIPG